MKVHLHGLGFAPTDRVKTTTTMMDKLRRTRGMELSRVQDLAGARITVLNLAAQDEAKAKICGFYTAQGCRWRETDRRKDPRYGYRALHLVVWVDGLPVEIQIRTELQDTWAQIVERLGDRWGRGIRYGQDPESPDAVVRMGAVTASRRGTIELLMTLSDAIAAVEQARRSMDRNQSVLEQVAKTIVAVKQAKLDPQRLASKIPAEVTDRLAPVVKILGAHPEYLDEEGRELLVLGADATGAQVVRMLEVSHDVYTRRNRDRAVKHLEFEERVRGILQLMASARDEGA